MWKRVLLVTTAMLPLHVDAACTFGDLKGRYAVMTGIESTGRWVRCNVKLDGNGRSTGSCTDGTGSVFPAVPIQFSITGNCRASGQSDDGTNMFFVKIEKHKRGATGRFEFHNRIQSFGGPVVVVKRGK